MSLFQKRTASLSAHEYVSEATSRRLGGGVGGPVNREQALRNSAWWACLSLRADLISTMPVDVFRRIDGVQVEQTKPPVFITPGGEECRWIEWNYSTQVDLDSAGNTVGVIVERDGSKLPKVIELADIDSVSFVGRGSKLTDVRIGRHEYDPKEIWHEKQFTRAGLAVGLSPIAYAATTLRNGLSAQQFAAEWFSNSTVPGGHLKNVNRKLDKTESAETKENFKASIQAGDVWVSGNDWEYNMLSAKASEAQFLEQIDATVTDVCRYLRVPGDMIDAPVKGSSVTYARIDQRNLQLLIMNLNPAILRREEAWSYGMLPRPRYAKANRSALLAMDTLSRYQAYGAAIDKRFMAPSEVRDLEDLPPFTDEQLAEFAIFAKAPTPVAPITPKEGL